MCPTSLRFFSVLSVLGVLDGQEWHSLRSPTALLQTCPPLTCCAQSARRARPEALVADRLEELCKLLSE